MISCDLLFVFSKKKKKESIPRNGALSNQEVPFLFFLKKTNVKITANFVFSCTKVISKGR
jgi:hypothetical protein